MQTNDTQKGTLINSNTQKSNAKREDRHSLVWSTFDLRQGNGSGLFFQPGACTAPSNVKLATLLSAQANNSAPVGYMF